ncbi:MAG: type II secretion system F family protein [Acidimicrobiales bacterium]
MIVAVLALVGGLAVMISAGLVQRRAERRAIDELLGLAPLSPDESGQGDDLSAITVRAVDLAGQVVERMDTGGRLSHALEQAKVPLRPGEFVVIVIGAALGMAAVVLVATHALPVAIAAALGAMPLSVLVLRFRVARRRKKFEAQLPDALALVASSLTAGHTFLRAIQLMCEEAGPPLSEEFSQIVAETRLGDPTVVALERMAARLQIRDMDIVVQAIRIQQTIGGRLADLLHTLADFIRARGEIRREVNVLTAEGRMSAYVLAGLVPFLFGLLELLNPSYVAPLHQGWGLVLLALCGASVLVGLLVILRMVKIEI